MGLFDSIAKQVLGAASGGKREMATDALGGLLNQVGGIEGLMQRAKATGLESVVSSWVGTGPNAEVTPDQMHTLLGEEAVQGVAAKSGFDVQQLLPLLAKFFPSVIDTLTPKGKIEQGATSAHGLDLGGILASVMNQQGGIGGMLSGLMGGQK